MTANDSAITYQQEFFTPKTQTCYSSHRDEKTKTQQRRLYLTNNSIASEQLT